MFEQELTSHLIQTYAYLETFIINLSDTGSKVTEIWNSKNEYNNVTLGKNTHNY